MNSRITLEELDNDDIDENKLNEFDQEVSNYLEDLHDENEGSNHHPNEELIDNNSGYNYNDYEIQPNYHYKNKDERNEYNNYSYNASPNLINSANNFRSTFPIENPNITKTKKLQNMNFNLTEENEKLKSKIQEYQKLNKEWELKMNNIKNVLNQVEAKCNFYKEEYEKAKDENEQCQFKLKLLVEKDKIYESNLKNLKEIQTGYETQNNDIKREYKLKEENLKKRYEKFEDNMNEKLKNQEDDYNEIVLKLNNQLKNLQKSNELFEKECEELREKLCQSENYFQSKEREFNEIVLSKDRKLKELENSIRSISEEANNQIDKLTDSVTEFNEKINFYKQRELQITEEYQNLKNYFKSFQNNPYIEQQLDHHSKNEKTNFNKQKDKSKINSTNSIMDLTKDQSQSKTIELLRSRVQELEEEAIQLSSDLNIKYEECEALNDQLRAIQENTRNHESNMHLLIKDKDGEITNLTNKINHLDSIITKYGKNLDNIKKSYEKSVHNHKVELKKRDHDMIKFKGAYEQRISELQNKIEVILKENLKILNKNNPDQVYSNNHNLILENNPFGYTPIDIPDDEAVRKNISDQINYIKEKLDKTFYS